MRRKTLILADSNVEYIENFKRYIRETEYEKKFIIKSFSKIENLKQFLISEAGIEILLVDYQFLSDDLPLDKVNTLILLSEEPNIDEDLQYFAIYKYQPLNKLVSQVSGVYLENHKEGKGIVNDFSTKVVSIYSASGGSGKTTVALNIARILSLKGKKIFYLNLEVYSSSEIFFSDTGSYDFSKIIFYLKNNPSQVVSKIEVLKKHDIDLKVDYIESYANANEIYEAAYEDINLLINSIKKLELYDYIIIDLESSLQSYVISTLIESDYIYWLLLDDIQSIYKTNKAKTALEKQLKTQYELIDKKIILILNKYLGIEVRNDFSKSNMKISGFLPYIPEWKAITQGNQITHNDTFISGIEGLLTIMENE